MVYSMISYQPLWATMKNRGISQYKLIKDYHFSTGQLDRLRKNDSVSTNTLDMLCSILDCKLEEVAVYLPDEADFSN
jgi:putative transcriptional regulator